MRAILIDPKLHRIHDIELAGNTDRQIGDSMYKLIGCQCLDSARINDVGDRVWVDDAGLKQATCFAFKIGETLFAGIGIVLGHTRHGTTQSPRAPVEWVESVIDWLDEIEPEVTEVSTELPGGGMKISLVVTYKRAGRRH